MTRKCASARHLKVAVLLSQITNSSGEIVALSFKGRSNTRFFGEKTAGYTTGNDSPYYIDKNSMLVVASVFIEDRNHYLYTGSVEPDVVIIHGDNFKDIEKDSKIQAAVQWMR